MKSVNINATYRIFAQRIRVRQSAYPRSVTMCTLVWLAFLPITRAVSPPPDGGYPNYNTAEGDNALFSLTTGGNNTALGSNALRDDQSGSANTAVGSGALAITGGSNNTAVGFEALLNDFSGRSNTAVGVDALVSNNGGDANIAVGQVALSKNTNGSGNVAIGVQALANADSSGNTAIGLSALFLDTFGSANTATGHLALSSNETGDNNTADGYEALYNSKGSNNIGLGANAGLNLTTGNNDIDIGNQGKAGEGNTIRIGTSQGRTFIAGISGKTVPGTSAAVYINANGQLGTIQSSARFKDNIKPMNNTSEAILKLKPVTFRYKEQLDPDKVPQFGLIAEEVEKVNPDLVVRDDEGKLMTVRYEAVNAMLLNEFLKAHRKMEQQQETIAYLQKQIETLTTGLQKVSSQINAGNPDPQLSATY